jgi:hypothetical protein
MSRSAMGVPSMNRVTRIPSGQEGDHLGAHAQPSRGDRRRVLNLAADAQQVGVVAGHADDEPLGQAIGTHEVVAVGDAPGEGSEHELPAGDVRHPLHRRDELVMELPVQDVRRAVAHAPWPLRFRQGRSDGCTAARPGTRFVDRG